MLQYSQLEFPVLIIAIVANLTLAIIVLQYAARNRSRYLFSLFVLAQVAWFAVNYFSFRVSPNHFLLVVRSTLFFATIHASSFFLFIYTFLSEETVLNKRLLIVWTILTAAVAAWTLSPYVFFSPTFDPVTGTLSPQVGQQAIAAFGIFVAACILGGFSVLIRRFLAAKDEARNQWRYLTMGLTLTFILVLIFSFANFVFLNNASTVRFGHLYTLPFVFFTAFAMVRHKLLDIKALVAEIAVIILTSILLVQLFSSNTAGEFVVTGFTLVGFIIVGVLLIKGVRREVEQRERLQVLTVQLEQANEKLKQLDQARADFINIASHQLRTPPATIKWYLAAVLAGDFGALPPEAQNELKKTEATNNALIALIDDMLNASRIERGKMEFLFEPIDVQSLTQAAVEQLGPIAQMKHLELIYHKPSEVLPKITADREKLKQVVNNLVDNSIKYTTKGTITVDLKQTNDDIVVTVTDTGKGIPLGQAKELFAKYNRGKDSVTHAAGLGLGLYVAKIIVDQHKGKIWAESKGENMGSTFGFSIPIHNNLTETTLFDLSQGESVQIGTAMIKPN